MTRQKEKAIKDIRDVQETIDKLNAGKFTFGSIFKNDTQKKQAVVEKQEVKAKLEKDVVNFDYIKKFLTIYLATVALPNFKK